MSLRMRASEAGSKVWDWSMGSLEVALYGIVNLRTLRSLVEY